MKKWTASSRVRGPRGEGRVIHEQEDPGCKKCGNCGKKTQGKKMASGIYNCHVMEEGDSFAGRVTGERYKIRQKINCESRNVVYVVESKKYGKQGVGSTEDFKPGIFSYISYSHETSHLQVSATFLCKPGHSVKDFGIKGIVKLTNPPPPPTLTKRRQEIRY